MKIISGRDFSLRKLSVYEEKCGVILETYRKDIKQYKWAGQLLLIYYIVVKAAFHAFCPSSYPDWAALSGLRHYKGAYLYFSGTVRKGVAAEPMRFLMVLFGVYFVYMRYVKGKRGKVCHGNLAAAAALMRPCLYISHGYGIS